VRERRHLGEQLWRHVLAGDDQVDRLGAGCGEEIFTFRDEQPKLVAPAPVSEPADATSNAATRRAGLAKPPAATVR
jgi:hypothetical protein